jgi:hypothetical protein
MRADSFQHLRMGNRDGEEGFEAATVDKGGCPDAEGAGAREDKDDGDREKTEAERGRNAPKSNATWGEAGGVSKEDGVNLIRLDGVARYRKSDARGE